MIKQTGKTALELAKNNAVKTAITEFASVSNEERLVTAAEKGETVRVREVLQRGRVDVNYRNKVGCSKYNS